MTIRKEQFGITTTRKAIERMDELAAKYNTSRSDIITRLFENFDFTIVKTEQWGMSPSGSTDDIAAGARADAINDIMNED